MVSGEIWAVDFRNDETLSLQWSARRVVYPIVGVLLSGALFATGVLSLWSYLLVCAASSAAIGYVLGREEDLLASMCAVDPLTGLHSKSYLRGRLAGEVKRAERQGTALAMVMIDVDQLGAINERHGNEAGNRVLLAVAAAIRAQLRGGDVAARWGEDEFVVLLREATAAGARQFAERVLRRVGEYHHALALRISTTFGVADRTADTDMLSEGLLLAAVRDLRRAKAEKPSIQPLAMDLRPVAF